MARPVGFDAPASEVIRVRVTPTQLQDIKQAARDNRTSMAGLIREAVNEYVADYRESPCFVAQNKQSSAQ